MKAYNVAVVGATGLVGQMFLKLLDERKFPIKSLTLYASVKSAGKSILFQGQAYEVLELSEKTIKDDLDFAFFSAGGQTSLTYAPLFAKHQTIVIDNSSAWRMDRVIPLVVPQVNGYVLKKDDYIIANPNCSTITTVLPLSIIHELFGINRVLYSTYQAVSGSGYKGTLDLANGKQGIEPSFYPKPIEGNVIPHIDLFTDNGYTKEELKMVNETKKILGLDELKVSATCVRVPVINSHSVSVIAECHHEVNLNALEKRLSQTEGLVYYAKEQYPTPIEVSGSDLIHVGRLRKDLSFDSGISFWSVADNIRKGAATNAIEIAEYMIKEGLK